MLALLVAALLRHRTVATLLLVLVVVIAAAGLLRLRLDFSSQAFYGGEPEMAERLAGHEAVWGADDDLLFVLVHTNADDPAGVLPRARLDAIADVALELESVDGVERASTIARQQVPLPALLGDEGETLEFAELIERTRLDRLDESEREPWMRRMPFVPALLSVDGRDTLIVVELSFRSDDVMRTEAVVAEIRERLLARQATFDELGLHWELAGIAAIRAGFFELVVRDQTRFVPLTLMLIGLSLFAVFRRWHAVLIPAIAAGVPTLMLVGIMGWIGEPVGLLNQAYFTLLPVIAVADAIHMVARVHEQLAEDRNEEDPERNRERAIAIATQRVGLACFLTSLTTAFGFGSLATAEMPILRAFGLYAALGVSLAFVVVLVVVPLLLSVVPVERLRADERRSLSDALVRGCVRVAARRPVLVLVGATLLTAAAVPMALRVEIDNRLVELLEPEHPVAQASARVDERLGGSLGLEFDVILPPGLELDDPALLERLLGFERWLAQQEPVRSVEGLAGMIAALEGSIPDEREQVQARLDELARLIPIERLVAPGRTRLRAGLPDVGGRAFIEFADRAELELRDRLENTGVEVHATGTPLLAYRGVNHITTDLRSSFSLVFVVIIVVIALVFRSLGPALLAVPVNAMPLLLGYSLLGVIGTVLDPLAAVILTLALGIAVDDTLHVMVRVREELGSNPRPDRAARRAALERAMQHSGRAVVITSVVVAGGLALNCLSSFPPLQLLGLLGSSVLALALLANLMVLPALIVVIGKR